VLCGLASFLRGRQKAAEPGENDENTL
jgi:hypothetical protein